MSKIKIQSILGKGLDVYFVGMLRCILCILGEGLCSPVGHLQADIKYLLVFSRWWQFPLSLLRNLIHLLSLFNTMDSEENTLIIQFLRSHNIGMFEE